MSNALYLETDEDITSAVDKLKSSEGTDVQVVVPKRSTLLQSMINLKLLKRAAEDSKKNLVLVTTDRLSSHLAGRVGLAVADKLGAEAKVPETKIEEPDEAEVIDGGLAETGAAETALGEKEPEEKTEEPKLEAGSKPNDDALPLPGSDEDATKSASAAPVMKTKALADEPKPTKAKTSRVPDFNALQKRILWASLAVIVIIALFVANWLLTSATVTVYAKGSQIPLTANFTADPAVSSSDTKAGKLKAQDITSSKDLSEQVPATGQQDVGTKAAGSMTVSNCFDNSSHTFGAGTKFSSPDGKIFISTADVTVPPANLNIFGCTKAGQANVNVQAASNGDSYNLASGVKYSIPSLPSSQQSYINGTGGQMSGGTSKVVTVVQQSDVDKAVADMLSKDKDGAAKDLASKASGGNKFINESLTQSQTNVTSDTAVGGQASNVTVKVTVGYDALAISSSDLDALLTSQAQQQAGADAQVYDDGAANAQFSQVKKNDGGSQDLKVSTNASAGPKIDTQSIAKQIKGKKYGDATDLIGKLPGVDHADVNINPSWATSLPSRASRIKVNVKVATSGG